MNDDTFKDYDIVYIEEKAPEPWIQREPIYVKDLPSPDDDDDKETSGAKKIGSFMMPSPLMRLKTPSSLGSSSENESIYDGRNSPVPSLDGSLKSERKEHGTNLLGVNGYLHASGSHSLLSGLFASPSISAQPVEVNISAESETSLITATLTSQEDLGLEDKVSGDLHQFGDIKENEAHCYGTEVSGENVNSRQIFATESGKYYNDLNQEEITDKSSSNTEAIHGNTQRSASLGRNGSEHESGSELKISKNQYSESRQSKVDDKSLEKHADFVPDSNSIEKSGQSSANIKAQGKPNFASIVENEGTAIDANNGESTSALQEKEAQAASATAATTSTAGIASVPFFASALAAFGIASATADQNDADRGIDQNSLKPESVSTESLSKSESSENVCVSFENVKDEHVIENGSSIEALKIDIAEERGLMDQNQGLVGQEQQTAGYTTTLHSVEMGVNHEAEKEFSPELKDNQTDKILESSTLESLQSTQTENPELQSEPSSSRIEKLASAIESGEEFNDTSRPNELHEHNNEGDIVSDNQIDFGVNEAEHEHNNAGDIVPDNQIDNAANEVVHLGASNFETQQEINGYRGPKVKSSSGQSNLISTNEANDITQENSKVISADSGIDIFASAVEKSTRDDIEHNKEESDSELSTIGDTLGSMLATSALIESGAQLLSPSAKHRDVSVHGIEEDLQENKTSVEKDHEANNSALDDMKQHESTMDLIQPAEAEHSNLGSEHGLGENIYSTKRHNKNEVSNNVDSSLLGSNAIVNDSSDMNNPIEAENDIDSAYEARLSLLTARCRNADDLLKQLAELIAEMNKEISDLTDENNTQRKRIKTLEIALQENSNKK